MLSKLVSVFAGMTVHLVLFAACFAQETQSPAQRGAQHYANLCSVCHGGTGEGYKADQATALANQEFLASVGDDFLRDTISEGRDGTTMSAWAARRGGPLTDEQIGEVIAFIRSWSKRPAATLNEKETSGSPAKGKTLFEKQCALCHGTDGKGGPNVNIGQSRYLHKAGNGYLRYAISGGREGTVMPGYQSSLGNQGIEDVVAYLRSLQPPALAVDRPAPLPPLVLGPTPLNPAGPEPDGFLAYPQMTPADVIKSEYDAKAKMAILDARAPSDYVKEHIAGAVSVPFYNPEKYFDKLPKDAWLVCYCACPHAESGQLARKLQEKGFTKVTVLDEGLLYWKSKKWPTRIETSKP